MIMPSPTAADGCHFLDACFLCKKRLAKNKEIFMYRGNNPFCSKECRWEQMDMDEALEKEAAAAGKRRKPTLNTAAAASVCGTGKSRCFAADTAIFAVY